MPDPRLIRLAKKNYLEVLPKLVGVELFKTIWVLDTSSGQVRDTLLDGEESCAYVVTAILTIHKLINSPCSTVPTAITKMEAAGWYKTEAPMPGDVVVWPPLNGHLHIGFYLGPNDCVSNSSTERVPVRHPLQLADGREPEAYFTHGTLRRQEL